MKAPARLLHLGTVSIGILGVGLCVTAAVVLWRVGSRATQANHRVFDIVDTALAAGRDRVLAAQTRVQESKISAEDVRQGLEAWARREASQRLASRPEIQMTTERFGLGLQQVEGWLDASGTSLQNVQQAVGLASSLGAPADPALVDPLLEKLETLRGRVNQSAETVNAIRARIDQLADGEPLEERLSRFAQLALRVVATLGDIDARLGDLADGLMNTRTRATDTRFRVDRYILVAKLVMLLLVGWMAAGQVFLGRYGWTQYRK